MKAIKRTIWVGRNCKRADCVGPFGNIALEASPAKGQKDEWCPEDWPPIRCTLTITPCEKRVRA